MIKNVERAQEYFVQPQELPENLKSLFRGVCMMVSQQQNVTLSICSFCFQPIADFSDS